MLDAQEWKRYVSQIQAAAAADTFAATGSAG
jgi:hypothetical protein